MTRQPENQIFGFQAETFAKPQNNSLVLGFSLFQHKHNKIKSNNHTNPTITAHFQPEKITRPVILDALSHFTQFLF